MFDDKDHSHPHFTTTHLGTKTI